MVRASPAPPIRRPKRTAEKTSAVLEDDSDDKLYAQSFLFPTRGEPSRCHGRSSHERRANKERERVEWRERLMRDYFEVPDEKI
ncbi:hypothetical protein F441_19329 [Phytophthora nicotianae CJ01A1]|uniref:Uncharacterized protein n=3 Tax=Phytophthora nicotianae TaxID=4792 RepID=W2I2T9_PHYNI|nr:hypothetical protein L915_18927 [Phytophthora nicotianae]ETL27668.1 hypothetical protein L916_18824 [Phytophthora nicotianae]ETO62672.1 hypothetical protein F444_19458 [Phytophthora nicotianae P1976]ETP03763.1 hypothetical protein F441_19329 [Phytophthora nicotianae CJ01A1]